ncbi:MAG TPA: dihydrofolate reductase [Burkholderiales bacterium]|jgi:dihydrofolate reductase|nr:dihydrofolate reductase [Burkholderiales bacterium]
MSHSSASQGEPRIYLVAAVAANGIIGANGKLPWHLPEDLKHFKRLTLGHPVIMGRRTWESLPGGALPGRENIVVSRNPSFHAPGAAVATSLDAAIAFCAGESLAFVIGGTSLFAEALPIASGLVMTEIHRDYPGDTSFPAYDRAQWRESQREAHTGADGVRFDFVLYERAT